MKGIVNWRHIRILFLDLTYSYDLELFTPTYLHGLGTVSAFWGCT
jgi:hypothetical protein